MGEGMSGRMGGGGKGDGERCWGKKASGQWAGGRSAGGAEGQEGRRAERQDSRGQGVVDQHGVDRKRSEHVCLKRANTEKTWAARPWSAPPRPCLSRSRSHPDPRCHFHYFLFPRLLFHCSYFIMLNSFKDPLFPQILELDPKDFMACQD